MEINGIAHLALTVNDLARCAAFYDELLPFLGMKCVHRGDDHLYYVGGRTALGISRCHDEWKHETFQQGRIGLHHLCLRARERKHVDEVHAHLLEMGATIIHPPEPGQWGPDYYSVLFEDPDGIRIEVNHVPGRGLFEEGARFDPASDY